jgi:hypothetical protein
LETKRHNLLAWLQVPVNDDASQHIVIGQQIQHLARDCVGICPVISIRCPRLSNNVWHVFCEFSGGYWRIMKHGGRAASPARLDP